VTSRRLSLMLTCGGVVFFDPDPLFLLPDGKSLHPHSTVCSSIPFDLIAGCDSRSSSRPLGNRHHSFGLLLSPSPTSSAGKMLKLRCTWSTILELTLVIPVLFPDLLVRAMINLSLFSPLLSPRLYSRVERTRSAHSPFSFPTFNAIFSVRLFFSILDHV